MHAKHPKKEVNDALDYAARQGFTVERTVSGHRWGRIKCTCGASVSIWSTLRALITTGFICAGGSNATTSRMSTRRDDD